MFVLTSSEMREADRYTIEEVGIPGIILMENAGIGVVRAINERMPTGEPRSVLIICGKGNNGGDGFVVARHLHLAGDDVDVVLLGKAEEVSGDAAINLEIAIRLGLSFVEIEDIDDCEKKINFDKYQIIVDAILGTGIAKPLSGLFQYIVEKISSSTAFIVAVDIPTGLPTDSGDLIGEAVAADLTVTFGYPKLSHILPPAEDYCGEVIVVDICIPEEGVKFKSGKREIITADSLKSLIRIRDNSSHKGNYGHLVVVAGSMGKMGAATLTAKGASRSGTGLVTVAAPKTAVPVIQSKLTEEMAIALDETESGTIHSSAFEKIMEFSFDKSAMVIGPGMGNNKETAEFVKKIIGSIEIPIVIDADALNVLAGEIEILKQAKAPIVLMPHPGEFSRLNKVSTVEIQRDRIGYASKYAAAWSVVIVLKGYRTVVAAPNGDTYICLTGNPGMATGGTGDLLTGMIGGLIASGLDPLGASRLAVYLHGRAGDLAAERKGQISLVAGDLLELIPETFLELV